MLSLRVVAPDDLGPAVRDVLSDGCVAQLSVYPGASVMPSGDVYVAEVAREGADALVKVLRDIGIEERGALSITDLSSAPYRRAADAEEAAPGSPDDGVLWEAVEDHAHGATRPSFAYFAFLTLATALASVAVLTDSPILVVGAMVVGPEFAMVTALCVGLARGKPRIAVRALGLLVAGFALAIAVVTLVSLVGRGIGWVDAGMVTRERPMTDFVWRPDRWSIVVALLAGAAGVLSVTAGSANTLVGVFISVTTVPAAGNLALALATWTPHEMAGSAVQLLVNLAGMVAAGLVTLWAQQLAWSRVERLRPRRR